MAGIFVLSQVIYVSSCEKNWSAGKTGKLIHSKIRKRMDPSTTEKLVYVYSNMLTSSDSRS
jgi:hypothetical protein